MAKLYPYLSFTNAKQALAYYEEVFDATNIVRMPVGKEQAKEFNVSLEELENTTIHGMFTVLGADLFCSDNFMKEAQKGHQVSILLDINCEDKIAAKEADEFFQKVSRSGAVTVKMPYEAQFWGGKMGQIVDKYGILWMLHSQPYSKLDKK